jgi:uncharacterized cupin superfamily protein
MVEEARLEKSEYGLVAETEGWFVVNVRDAAWMTNDFFGAACIFEGGSVDFAQVGFTLGVIPPGRPSGIYHREANQENLLVLAGEGLLLVEGEERPLRQWDFVHFPAGTDHMVVATGDEPCVVFMTGARSGWPEKGIVYPRSAVALRHGAGVEEETTVPSEAYAPYPKWLPGRPEALDLPSV